MNAIFTRASVRHFEQREVEQEKIEKILQAAFMAPTACNQQPWEFYVVTDKDILQQLSKVTPYSGPIANASVAIVVCYRRDNLKEPEMAHIDCAIATENIWLECEELGLGGVMIGIAPFEERMQAVAKVMNLPESLIAFTIFPFGYPQSKPERKSRYDPSRVHFIK